MSAALSLPGPRPAAVAMVLGPLLLVVEAVVSPLDGRSTLLDADAIAGHEGRFEASLLVGLIGTVLVLVAAVGLARACLAASPRLARAGGWLLSGALCCFLVVRGAQVAELAAIDAQVSSHQVAQMFDRLGSSVIGIVVFVPFILGALLGNILLGAAAWRAGFPRFAAVLLALFQLVDLALPEHPESLTAVSHLVLLVALGTFAVRIWAGGPDPAPRRARRTASPAAA